MARKLLPVKPPPNPCRVKDCGEMGVILFINPMGGQPHWVRRNLCPQHASELSLATHAATRAARGITSNRPRNQRWASTRFAILKRDNYRCRICGATADDGVKLHVDHKVPLAKGGENGEENLWTLCDLCNYGKGTGDI